MVSLRCCMRLAHTNWLHHEWRYYSQRRTLRRLLSNDASTLVPFTRMICGTAVGSLLFSIGIRPVTTDDVTWFASYSFLDLLHSARTRTPHAHTPAQHCTGPSMTSFAFQTAFSLDAVRIERLPDLHGNAKALFCLVLLPFRRKHASGESSLTRFGILVNHFLDSWVPYLCAPKLLLNVLDTAVGAEQS